MADHFEESIEAFRDWLPYSGRRKSPGTIGLYARQAERLAAWARAQGRQSFQELSRADLRSFLSSLTGRGGGPASDAWRATVWAGIRSLYRYLSDEESTPDIAARIMVGQAAEPDRVDHLDRDQVERLLKACHTPKEAAVIGVFLDSGARISEVAGLQVTDVLLSDLRARHLLVHGKGGRDRAVVIGDRTSTALRRYLRWRAESKHAGLPDLWVGERGPMGISGIDKLVRAVGARAGLPGLHAHMLRHTWSHFFRLDGGSTDVMCYLAGWRSAQMPLRYARSGASERAEQEARRLGSLVDKLGPMRKRTL